MAVDLGAGVNVNPPQMQGEERIPLDQLLTNLAHQISLSVNKRQVVPNIPIFTGVASEYTIWVQELEKYIFISELHEQQTTLLAYQYSKGAPSDFISRYLKTTVQANWNWENLKGQLTSRFSSICDQKMAFGLLMKVRQGPSESIQAYAEKLINLAKEAFKNDEIPLEPVQRQLINFFMDGLRNDSLRMKILRTNPRRLENAIELAIEENNFITLYGLRNNQRSFENAGHEQMEVDHYRRFRSQPKVFCRICQNNTHDTRMCRNRKQVRTVQVNQSEAEIICWFCGQKGHMKRNCRKKNKRAHLN